MSGQTQQPALPSTRCLLGMAEELQVYILLELAPVDILACMKACRALEELVKRTPAVQYKLELGLAGMVDGPAQGVFVAKRLEQLRAYQAAWRENDIPMQTAVIPRGAPRPYFKMLRPASVFSGITEEANVMKIKEDIVRGIDIQGSAVDIAQNLVVVTKLELGELPELFVLSLDGAFHPLAANPHLEGDAELSICIDPQETLEICGDLIAWSIATDSTEITVRNWKTGCTVWTSGEWHDENPMFYLRCHFLDPTHILIVENLNLYIHEVDPAQPNCNAPYDHALCTLKLPALAGKKGSHAVESDIRIPPVYPGANALFQRDPALTLLTLKFSACDDPIWRSSASTPCKSFVALVPLSTLFAQLERTRNKSKPSPPEGEKVRKGRKAKVASWEEWSPLGARLIEVKDDGDFRVCAMGSQCLIVPCGKEGETKEDVHLFDAHPLAGDAPHAEVDLSESVVRAGECITDPEWFVNPVHNTLPYRVARKTFDRRAEPGARQYTGELSISHDGLVGVSYKLPPQQ